MKTKVSKHKPVSISINKLVEFLEEYNISIIKTYSFNNITRYIELDMEMYGRRVIINVPLKYNVTQYHHNKHLTESSESNKNSNQVAFSKYIHTEFHKTLDHELSNIYDVATVSSNYLIIDNKIYALHKNMHTETEYDDYNIVDDTIFNRVDKFINQESRKENDTASIDTESISDSDSNESSSESEDPVPEVEILDDNRDSKFFDKREYHSIGIMYLVIDIKEFLEHLDDEYFNTIMSYYNTINEIDYKYKYYLTRMLSRKLDSLKKVIDNALDDMNDIELKYKDYNTKLLESYSNIKRKHTTQDMKEKSAKLLRNIKKLIRKNNNELSDIRNQMIKYISCYDYDIDNLIKNGQVHVQEKKYTT